MFHPFRKGRAAIVAIRGLGVTAQVSGMMGDAMSTALSSMSTEAFQSELADFQNFGTLFGDAIKTADTFALVAAPWPWSIRGYKRSA